MSTEKKTIKQAIKEAAEEAGSFATTHGALLVGVEEDIADRKVREISEQPLTEEKVREMVGELDWKWIDGGGYEAETPFGTYRVYGYGPLGGGYAKCFLEWSSKRLEKWMVDGMIEEAQKACQRDYEDRVLRCLGFETENKE